MANMASRPFLSSFISSSTRALPSVIQINKDILIMAAELTAQSMPLGQPSGFSFENVHRNKMLEAMSKTKNFRAAAGTTGMKMPTAKKTGTTIAGLVFRNGVVLGADTRATNGSEVAEKNCSKIHYLAPNIYCCGAGTAADTDKTTELISTQLELLRMETHSTQSRVVTACTLLKRMLFRYQGYISAALVLGGVDLKGPHVYQIYPHGSTGKLPYTTMGSGSLAAMSVFEQGWRDNMEEAEAVELVKRAILAGIFNDLGSGSNCDITIIRNDGSVEKIRGAVLPNAVKPLRDAIQHSATLTISKGTSAVLASKYEQFPTLADVEVTEMETDDV